MEYLNGLNLDNLVRVHGPQPDGRVVEILLQVCASLNEAHSMKLIHRDIKPANVIISARSGIFDLVKLLDFGLVKAIDSSSQISLTHHAGIVGTPLYLSPEAIQDPESVDVRSDLYAVGAVGYFLLTGSPVFDGKGILDIMKQHVQATPEPPSSRGGQAVSRALENLVLRCLSKNPSDRPQTAKQLIHELKDCAVLHSWTEMDAENWWRRIRPSEAGQATVLTGDGRFEVTMNS